MVYRMMFEGEEIPLHCRPMPAPRYGEAWSHAPNILLSCRTVYDEAVVLYYRHSTFTCLYWKDLYIWLRNLPPTLRVQVRSIHWDNVGLMKRWRAARGMVTPAVAAETLVTPLLEPCFTIARDQMVRAHGISRPGVIKCSLLTNEGKLVWTDTPVQTFHEEERKRLERLRKEGEKHDLEKREQREL